MSRVSMFSSPLFLGFEDFERTLDRISKMQPEGYPPYNIEQMARTGSASHSRLLAFLITTCRSNWKITNSSSEVAKKTLAIGSFYIGA